MPHDDDASKSDSKHINAHKMKRDYDIIHYHQHRAAAATLPQFSRIFYIWKKKNILIINKIH